MKISRGLILSLIVIALAAVAYSQFQSTLVALTYAGAPTAPPVAARESHPGFTEEQWTIMEVSDQILFLLHPESIRQAAGTNRITAERNNTEPVSYTVAEGTAKGTITLNASAWDPATYQTWCKTVSTNETAPAASAQRPDILKELLTPQTGNFLALDQRLSAELAKQPHDPAICTDAALLLGTMAWFDEGGLFQDVRPLLHRMTAFLAVADAGGARGTNREVAGILRLVLLHDQVGAVAKISAARKAGPTYPAAWLDALEVTATGDWRKTEPAAARGPVLLQLAHYRVLTKHMGANKAESFLKSVTNPAGSDWVRAITQAQLGIRQGHMYSRSLLGMEAAEANTVANTLGEGSVLKPKESYATFVTKFDGRAGYERPPETRIVGTQNWAGRTQRHFLQSLVVLHDFLQNRLGVPDEADAFKEAMRKQFASAYYFPFLSLEIEKAGSPRAREAQFAAEKITREHSAMVAPKLWASLKPETPEGIARHTPDFHVFFNPELPRQTSFEAGKRIVEIGVGDENSLPLLESILVRCPYDFEMAIQTAMVEGRPNNIEGKKMECYERFSEIHEWAMDWTAQNSMGNPQKYERLKLAKAQWDPNAYVELSSYYEDRNDMAKAEKFLLLARGKVDAVLFANACGFLVKYYATHGRTKDAENLAAEAAETYSGYGLLAFAWLKEYRQQWADAAKTYHAIDERYGRAMDSEELGYVVRRKISGLGWQPEFQKVIDTYFPRGIQKVSLAALGSAPPKAGACFTGTNETLRRTGISPRDVVVGIDGIRVENRDQYMAARKVSDSADMAFLVWDGQAYSEIKAHQPGRRFNLDLRDYRQ